MYAGHVALALGLKSREPEVPLVVLAMACYGPDWLELLLMFPKPREGMSPYTHSITAVLIGACVAALLYQLIARRPGAMQVMIGWLLHWPADVVTGRKPLTGLEDVVGLDLYHLPIADFALESMLVIIGCALFARQYATSGGHRRAVVLAGTVLIVMQALVNVSLARLDDSPWRPSLAPVDERWRPSLAPVDERAHLSCTYDDASDARRTALAALAGSNHSERAMANGPQGVITLVCLTCGKEKFFTTDVPAAVSCEQCGSSVFRTFTTPTEPDDAAIVTAEAQARSMAYGDSSPETTRDDVRDLDLL